MLTLLDHGVDDATGAPYLVMPRMRGEDMGQLLARVKVLEPSVAVPLVLQACRGVAAGHAAGIVHRDIKPSNLFLEEEDGVVIVKVSDFGLAKVQSAGIDSLTKSGALMGTPQYMAPEQAQDAKRVDARTDVYSLGMVLYHALTGGPAFTTSGAFMGFLVGQAKVPPLQAAAPWVPGEIARVVHAARRGRPKRAGPIRRARPRPRHGRGVRDGPLPTLQGVARAALEVDARRCGSGRNAARGAGKTCSGGEIPAALVRRSPPAAARGARAARSEGVAQRFSQRNVARKPVRSPRRNASRSAGICRGHLKAQRSVPNAAMRNALGARVCA